MEQVEQVLVIAFGKIQGGDMVNLPADSDNPVDFHDGNVQKFYFGMECVRQRSVLEGGTAESDKFFDESASEGVNSIGVFHRCLVGAAYN